MADGSDAIADWPLLNALVNTAAGATWVSIHHGGGVGIGYSQHAGMVVVADGTELAAQKLERVLTTDPGMGVARHVDAGYPRAIEVARERGVRIPMLEPPRSVDRRANAVRTGTHHGAVPSGLVAFWVWHRRSYHGRRPWAFPGDVGRVPLCPHLLRRPRRRLLPAVGTVLLLAGLLPASASPVLADSSGPVVAVLPELDATPSLITASDDWSGVPGIVGYRGDGMANVAGVDPQTVLGDGSGTPVDVNANVTDPRRFETGGVTEAEIADPTIALQGSGTARAPAPRHRRQPRSGLDEHHRRLQPARHRRVLGDNTTMQLALQYPRRRQRRLHERARRLTSPTRATAGTATLVTPVSAGLPAAVDNQPLVDVRILMTDAPSTDEMIGVDDISITAARQETTRRRSWLDESGERRGRRRRSPPRPTITFSEDVDARAVAASALSCTNQGAKPVTLTRRAVASSR